MARTGDSVVLVALSWVVVVVLVVVVELVVVVVVVVVLVLVEVVEVEQQLCGAPKTTPVHILM